MAVVQDGKQQHDGIARTDSEDQQREGYQSVKGSSADTNKTYAFEEPLCAAAESTVVKAT